MARTVNRLRNKENLLRGDEIQLSAEFTVTAKGEKFLLYDNESESNRIIMFATNGNIEMLAKCNEIFCDGTFGIVPTMFSQLYTIHGTIISTRTIIERTQKCSWLLLSLTRRSFQWMEYTIDICTGSKKIRSHVR